MEAEPSQWFEPRIAAGERRWTSIVVSESYSGANVTIPLHVWRGKRDGPTVCITGAVHGDEINGTGTIRYIVREQPFDLVAGTLVLVPVVNILGFDRHSRYLPDRRDLNRCFPGSTDGSLASRFAKSIFDQVSRRCEYGIDLHTASVRRTNFPNVRADLSDERVAAFARAFGAELMVNSKGPKGSLRSSACQAGCATLVLEAGEVWKVEPSVVEYSVRCIRNSLQFLEMVDGTPGKPPYRVETEVTKWVRARHGGFLEFHVAPGDTVEKDQPIATCASLRGEDVGIMYAPRNGIVVGMTTLPSVAPGDPVCHLAFPRKGALTKIERAVDKMDDGSLHERLRVDLATSMLISDSDEKR